MTVSIVGSSVYGPIEDDWALDESGITVDDSSPHAPSNYYVLCDGLGPRKGILPGSRRPAPRSKDILVFPGLTQRGGASRYYTRRPRRRV